jgi:hypothetical protein
MLLLNNIILVYTENIYKIIYFNQISMKKNLLILNYFILWIWC